MTLAPSSSLSLCYFAASDLSFNVLIDQAIAVQRGSPAVLPQSLQFTAQRIMSMTLSNFTPAVSDYLVFLANPSQCHGTTAPPEDVSVGTSTVFNTTTTTLSVTTVLPTPGTYYVCYAHASSNGCQSGVDGLECARVIGLTVVTGGFPVFWSLSPSPAYASEALMVGFTPNTPTSSRTTMTT
uniref:Oxygen-evolving enhancer protein 2-2, chloroplastic n=1 Tax=Lygus hesperus TaxID=30085 RepID=A0A0A9X1Z3_LYGHE